MPDEKSSRPIVVTHDGGVRFSAQVRSHRVVVDQPRAAGGEDAAPMPIELLGVALGTCTAYYVQKFLQARRLPYEGCASRCSNSLCATQAASGSSRCTLSCRHQLPPSQLELVERVLRSCPAHNTLGTATPVRSNIETFTPALM